MYLGIDCGTRNIGIAYSGDGRVALPIQVTTWDKLFPVLNQLILERKVHTLVLGVADTYDRSGRQRQQAHSYRHRILQGLTQSIQIELQDEDLTTFEAQDAQGQFGWDHLDAVAASIILQRYLDKTHK